MQEHITEEHITEEQLTRQRRIALLFKAEQYRLAKLDQAAEQGSNLGELLAKGNTARIVRDCGKLVFHNSSRAKAYRSKYFRNRNSDSSDNGANNDSPGE